MKILLVLPLILSACDSDIEFRENQNGCFYDEELNYNDDYKNLPHQCVMKLALCVDQNKSSCDIQPQDCKLKIDHCYESYEYCHKNAIN